MIKSKEFLGVYSGIIFKETPLGSAVSPLSGGIFSALVFRLP